ncbi:signal peptide peptidase SppA [uncultured Halomonas sp.]|uniref:signal peptide peptidase SppA n=1 Tax=uncultured Halomonas sp. TaxID=173971 RepID=UPI0026085EE3|nr:signal peptide peptidase SppA [uncultured Halomonas sp.]
MTDKRNEHGADLDPWTQGPELSRDEAKAPRQQSDPGALSPGEDAETLRERQRLEQMAMMGRWIDGVLVEQRRSRRWKLFFRFLFAALVAASLSVTLYGLLSGPAAVGGADAPHLGVVKVEGVIEAEGNASAERINAGLRRAWESEASEAVVLHINSPGGSPVQSQRIFDEVMRLRSEGDKPIIAVIEDIGASGAYYIAAGADEIIAAPASLVGSIGVIYSSFGFQEAIDQLGVERRVYTAGDNKAFLDPFSEVAPQQREFWQSVLDSTHEQFIAAVRKGRGERLGDDDALFSGLVWSGEQALELGLVDSLGSLDTLARERLSERRLHDYTPRLDPFERLSRQFGRVAMEWLGLPRADSPVRYQLR